MNSKIFLLFIFSLLLFAISYVWMQYAPEKFTTEYQIYIVPLFFFINLVFIFLKNIGRSKKPKKILIQQLAFSGIKMALYILILVMYGLFIKVDVLIFFVSFLIVYFIFFLWEIRFFVKQKN